LTTFDDLLLQVIDRTTRYTFGDANTEIIYGYLEKKGCSLREIPTRLNIFSEELRNILGLGKGQLLGVAPILEQAILEVLCNEMKIKFDRQKPASFSDQVKELREIYDNRQYMVLQPAGKGDSEEHDSALTQLPLQRRGGESCCK
jgi:hypothetical protein